VGAAAEKVDIPAVSIIAPQFDAFVNTGSRVEGISSLATAAIPFEVMASATESVRPACEAAVEEIIYGLTKWQPPEESVEEWQKWLVFEGEDYHEATSIMNNFFLSKRWSDGLPLVPPTQKLVDWMLTGTDLPRDKVITAEFEPLLTPITVESIAIYTVMAGGRPEYMAVILAIVDLLAADNAKLMRYPAESTQNFAPLMIVNGPIIKELNMNSSFGLLGPGWQANATIGRAISLLMINGAGAYIGPGGNATCQALPGRYTWCFAENEEETPWQPLHVELANASDVSTVCVMIGQGTQSISASPPVDNVVETIARTLKGMPTKRYAMPLDQLLVISPTHAHMLAGSGMSKEDFRNAVYEKARISIAEMTSFQAEMNQSLATENYKSAMIPIIEKPNNLVIIVGGGGGVGVSTFIPCVYKKRITAIDNYKPSNWRDLVNMAKGELQY